ncbi:hypothetical protein [Rodentibacter pneumotropicus]|nr:hypothetical protein [Rodentibacter pneumotropicus]
MAEVIASGGELANQINSKILGRRQRFSGSRIGASAVNFERTFSGDDGGE